MKKLSRLFLLLASLLFLVISACAVENSIKSNLSGSDSSYNQKEALSDVGDEDNNEIEDIPSTNLQINPSLSCQDGYYNYNNQCIAIPRSSSKYFTVQNMQYCYDSLNKTSNEISNVCITRDYGFVSLPEVLPRNTAPASVFLKGFDDGAIRPWDVMENLSEAGIMFFNSRPQLDMNKNFPLQIFKANQDAKVEFASKWSSEVYHVEWQAYALTCSGFSSFTVYNEDGRWGLAGLDGNLAWSFDANNPCFLTPNVAYDLGENFNLVIKNPPAGYQAVIWYRVFVRKPDGTKVVYNSLATEVVYVYVLE